MTDHADRGDADATADGTDDGPSLDASSLGDGWRVWSDADERTVLVYRPDIFDGGSFPPPCLPTVYVTRGRRNRRPGVEREAPPGAPWVVTLYLEPEVSADPETFDARADALEAARDLTARFTRGEVDYRDLYQVPRETYFAELDRLTGRDASG
jgi:hypothetical protein